ncbi:MAG: type II toxin-antitoxin system PemK/MazF family toxin [Pleurocapsa sp. SU_196_0]|nr:type II toxin-antitoxin system PemK/MazF family toxin [Pleurocapsa sp. SU_196_0]
MVRRGEIWRVNFNPSKGSEIQKQRPAVVISSDAMLLHPVRLVVPITGWSAGYDGRIWIVQIQPSPINGLDKVSAADTAQTRAVTVSVERFASRLGHLESETLEEITLALAALVELPSL